MTPPVISCRDVTYTIEGRPVLDRVSFTVGKGELYAIIGPNGGGKTTLLRIILGLLTPDRGEVTIFSRPPGEVRSRIGYVPQFRTFDFRYPITVEEMVLSGRLSLSPGLFARYTGSDRSLATEALDRMGIGHLKDREISALSGGEQQRAVIARALVGRPDLLILDEPMVSVDTPTEVRIFDLFDSLKGQVTVLLVTHDIGAISSRVTKVACLNRGIYTHDTAEITEDMIQSAYHCPVDLIAHGLPHRVLRDHEEGS